MSKKDKRPPQPTPPPPAAADALSPSRAASLVVWALVAAYAAVFTAISLVKYRYFLYDDFDLAICTQASWGILHGHFYNTVRGMYWLGDHSWFTLFLCAPLYALRRSAATLLVLQSVVLSLGALPVFWLARRELKSDALGVCFAALYLLYPALGYMNLYEFHPETMAATTLLFAFYFLWVGRFGWTIVFAVLSLMAKENAPLVVGMMGLYALTIKRPRRWMYSAALLLLAAAFLVVSFAVLKPALNHGESDYASMYASWGKTLGEAAGNVARHPVKALSQLFYTPDNPADSALKEQFWFHLLIPVMFLALLNPLTLIIALPVLGQHLLSARASEHTIVYHYTQLIIPFVMVSAVFGFRNLMRLLGQAGLVAARTNAGAPRHALAWVLAGAMLAAAVLGNFLFGPVLGSGVMQNRGADEAIRPSSEQRAMRPVMEDLLSRVPETGTVVSSFRFLPRLANRPSVHSWHHILSGHYSVSTKAYEPPTDAVAMIADMGEGRLWSFTRAQSGELARAFLDKNRLAPVASAGDAVLFLKDAPKPVKLWETGDFTPEVRRRVDYNGQLSLLGWDRLGASATHAGGVVPLRTFWRRMGVADRFYLTQFLLVRDADSAAQAATKPALEIPLAPRRLGYSLYPVHDWPLGVTVAERYQFVVPADVPAGDYTLSMRVIEDTLRDPLALSLPSDRTLNASNGCFIPLGRLRVE